MHLLIRNRIERAVHILDRPTHCMLAGEKTIGQRERCNCHHDGSGRAHGESPRREPSRRLRMQCDGRSRSPSRLPCWTKFATASLLHGMPARDTLVHVIFEQHPASLRQILVHICRDKRLEVITAPQHVRAKFGSGRTRERTQNALASLGNQLVVHLFVANVRE
jgi:hypothetical protein